MLENKLDELTASINKLNETIGKMNAITSTLANTDDLLEQLKPYISKPEVKTAETKPKATRKTKPKDVTKNKNVTEVDLDGEVDNGVSIANVTVEEAETLTRDDLQTLFVGIVRNDRTLKPKIKDVLKDHGANTLPELDPSKFAAVAEAVKAL